MFLAVVFGGLLGVAGSLADGWADEGFDGTADTGAEGVAGFGETAILGELDLAERFEILRNQYRRMTPGDAPLVQDVGTWPAAWEEFSPRWDTAPATRDLATWVVPVSSEREGGATVLRDGSGAELWRGTTDFAKDDSANVVLTDAIPALSNPAGSNPIETWGSEPLGRNINMVALRGINSSGNMGGSDFSEHSALKSLPLEQTKSIFDLVVQKGALNEMD